jgi:iron complex outermembrane receptor protein
MIYASAAEGIKAGGFNGYVTGSLTLDKDQQSFGEEKNWTYEVGWKASLFDRRVTFAADVFYVDWSNRQVAIPPAGYVATGVQGAVVPEIYAAAGAATDYGFELNGDYRAFPGLTFDYAFSAQNPTNSKGATIPNATLYCTGAACPKSDNVSGNEIGNTSRYTGELGAEYRHSFDNLPNWLAFSSYSDMSYFIGANETYRGMMYLDDLNITKINPFFLTDAHAGIQRGQIRLSVWVKNLTNHKYVESSFSVASIKQYNVDFGELRTFGITLNAAF